MRTHRRPMLLLATLSLLLATVAGLALAQPTAADTEGWPWPDTSAPTSKADAIPLDGPLCVDRDQQVYLSTNGRCASRLTTLHFSPQDPITVCAAPLDWLWLDDDWTYSASGRCPLFEPKIVVPSGVEPVHACAMGEQRQLRRTTEVSPCRKGEWLVSQRPLLVVTDATNNRVQKFFNDGTFITSWGSGGQNPGQFNSPIGIATDADNNVYVVDSYNDRIQVFDASGMYLREWGSSGFGEGQFDNPIGIGIDRRAGRVYVTENGFDPLNELSIFRVQAFDLAGTFLTTWGSAGSGDGQFEQPYGVGVDGAGLVYVVDPDNNRIQVFDADGTFLREWGGPGSGDGQFDIPFDIAFDALGEVYVTDRNNNRVQVFDEADAYLRQWGSSGAGPGQSTARLASPWMRLARSTLWIAQTNTSRSSTMMATSSTAGGVWGVVTASFKPRCSSP